MTATGVPPRPPTASGDDLPALARLRRLRQTREPEARCELCSTGITAHPNHEHILDPASGEILCGCLACAFLFDGEAQQRYRRIPRRIWALTDFVLDDVAWNALAIPVGMAFVQAPDIEDAEASVRYPSPAGAIEARIDRAGWSSLLGDNPALGTMQPRVEALLVHRIGSARDHFLVPIDRCYELVGLIRVSWRGLSGGQDAWARIAAFFDTLHRQATEHAASRA